jgi:predicted TIM-barrel fold metal-dependent hydrolase
MGFTAPPQLVIMIAPALAEAEKAMERVDGYCTIGREGEDEPPAEHLLGEMDRTGVARAVIAPSEACFAWANEAGNDSVLSAARRHPQRFIPAVTVNPWRPDAAKLAAEFVRQGGRILAFHPGVQGFATSEGRADAILENLLAADLKVPIYFHTGHHSHGAPAQLFLLAVRFPQLTFIMGHAGATDYADDVVRVCRQAANVYVESSFARPPGFVARATQIGFDRAVMGSGFPYNDLAFEWAEMERLLPTQHHASVLGGNLMRLLEGGT